ncbi:MAG: hypothetical protein WBG76_13370, partial [Ornithinimicrobium sp.]
VQQHLDGGGHVLLQGVAGIGKTRIAAGACQDRRLRVPHVDRLLGNERRAGILLSMLAPLGPPSTVSIDDQAAVFGWFLRRWREHSDGGAPALVWADDIHHCDPLSEAVLRHAVTVGVVQMVATHRSSEALGEGMQALVTEGLLTPWTLDPLARPEADALAQAISHTVLDHRELDRVHGLAAGNPLFIREVVASINGGVDVAESTTLQSIIGRPLISLSASRRRAFDLVAVADPAPVAVLQTHWDEIRELVAMGLLTQHDDATVHVDHPLRRVWALADLGSSAPAVWSDLLDVVHKEGLDDALDPVTLTDWQLGAGRQPPAELVERAVRLAIARRDAVTALRFVTLLSGHVATLLPGEALIICGDVHAGLAVLADMPTDAAVSLRAEAAFWRARYIALMLGDYRCAEAALDAVDEPHLPAEVRRVVLSGRLWLCVSGPIGDAAAMAAAREMSLRGPPDEVTFEICHVTATALSEITDASHVAPPIERSQHLQDAVTISAPALARARTVRMWWEASRGRGNEARLIGREAFELAETTYSLESLALLAGSAGWLTALTGHIVDACRISGSVKVVPETDDWVSFPTLAALLNQGNEHLQGDSSLRAAPSDQEQGPGAGPDLGRLFACRARLLACEQQRRSVDRVDVEGALRLLIGNRKHRWTAFFGLEMTSLSSAVAVHELIWASSNAGPQTGIVAVSGAAARARLDGDAVALLRCGQELEWAGLDGPVLRVLADTVRLTQPQYC